MTPGSGVSDDGLRREPHPTHAHVDRALEWIARVKPRRAILTNMHIDLDYVPGSSRSVSGIDVVLSSSFAFGGTNAVLVARRFS